MSSGPVLRSAGLSFICDVALPIESIALSIAEQGIGDAPWESALASISTCLHDKIPMELLKGSWSDADVWVRKAMLTEFHYLNPEHGRVKDLFERVGFHRVYCKGAGH